jgi:hypothetical protein
MTALRIRSGDHYVDVAVEDEATQLLIDEHGAELIPNGDLATAEALMIGPERVFELITEMERLRTDRSMPVLSDLPGLEPPIFCPQPGPAALPSRPRPDRLASWRQCHAKKRTQNRKRNKAARKSRRQNRKK